ncbi:thiol-disulfide oxidoreductase DCC family protein [Siminovitchia fortis]|uniref:Thiol-disulfide oxidoreductase DCC family protein n=1 Tax=Siminovitchia fortis TaxID=254758 RepID=A0A443IMI0_9BACI|nr:thiol-disulfide oxidoreductase DCC family protein [Siminovitchia fortis]RWR06541.1 thiol-disulfide oxidoreductase DCC family protein [Siminovitchia fortis]WHY80831.1 thiol-disulfide oxidoreductase DCC family protein [Siminovitchia fortis]
MNPIVLFDGVCNFCDASVRFIIKNDPKGTFRFASLQSDIGQKLLKERNVPSDIDSIILIEGDKAYYKSTAALRIARHLQGFWKLAYGFLIVPAPIRNLAYDFIASNRYKWFGKKESCMIPSPDVRERFLS